MVAELSRLPRAEAVRRAGVALERFNLIDAADRQARTYSGGMRRRLDLAASLIAEPPVVVLDEPTTGLDPAARLGLWGVIEDLARSGTTVLLTTQYLEEADRLAARIAVIDQGRIIAEGTAPCPKADRCSTGSGSPSHGSAASSSSSFPSLSAATGRSDHPA
jgi:ABC-2 type transport system ATP-binding protein